MYKETKMDIYIYSIYVVYLCLMHLYPPRLVVKNETTLQSAEHVTNQEPEKKTALCTETGVPCQDRLKLASPFTNPGILQNQGSHPPPPLVSSWPATATLRCRVNCSTLLSAAMLEIAAEGLLFGALALS
jgi:hypothetical protein